MPYPYDYYSTATRQLSTAFKDKHTTADRLRNSRPIITGSGGPLNRTGHIVAGSPGIRTSPRAPLRLMGAAEPKRSVSLFTMPHY